MKNLTLIQLYARDNDRITLWPSKFKTITSCDQMILMHTGGLCQNKFNKYTHMNVMLLGVPHRLDCTNVLYITCGYQGVGNIT